MLGTKKRVMIQLKTIMPSRENVAHVCSHDHLRTRVIGRMKVPCSKPASSTSRKPSSNGIEVIVAGPNCLRTKLGEPFPAPDSTCGLRREWATKGSHPRL